MKDIGIEHGRVFDPSHGLTEMDEGETLRGGGGGVFLSEVEEDQAKKNGDCDGHGGVNSDGDGVVVVMERSSSAEEIGICKGEALSSSSPMGENDALAFATVVEPGFASGDPSYITMRRLLLYRKALSGIVQRKAWQCNGIDYVVYKHYIRNGRTGGSQQFTSPYSTPGDSGRWVASPNSLSFGFDRDSSNLSKALPSSHVDQHSFNAIFSRHSSLSSVQTDGGRFPSNKEPAYSFVGMHCIFDQFKSSVNVVRFGHRSSELLAFGASDGGLAICTVADDPHVLHLLKGHTKSITDFDWSSNNQYFCSSSLDRSVRIWDVEKGHCVRVVYANSVQLCIRFHPVNNNFLLVGNANKELCVINFSTGRILHKLSFESSITSVDTDYTGHVIFAGDAKGCVHSVTVNSHTGELSRAHKNRLGMTRKSPIVTVEFRTFSLLANGPVLLAANQDGCIRFFSVALEVNGYLSLRCSLQLSPRARNIHASFCPLLSLEKGEFIVSGSEDTNVYFYDFTRPKHPCVNKLQGHGSPVIGVAWNYGENLLASSDCDGMVIVWKRAKDGQ